MKHVKYLFLLMLVLVLVACNDDSSAGTSTDEGSSGGDSGQPHIAVVLKGADQEYFKLAEAGAKQAFKDFDVKGTFLASSKETQEQELINILEDLLIQDPDGLVVMPSTGSAIPTLTKYHEKDIPVLLIDTDLNWDDKTTYIGTDNYTAGQKAGEFLESILSPGDEVAIIEGVPGGAQNEARVAGGKEYLEEKGFKVVTVQAADFDRTKAVSVMENIITAHPNIKGVYAANDEMALGAYQALKTANLTIPIVGVDGTTDGIQSIIDGGVTASVEQLPYKMAYMGVENAIKALNGETVEKQIDSGIELITQDNANEKLANVKELLGK
ncbi:sugar ABC transporter substrate-binding protein [Lysinibacillus sp. NPDC098008]|uniref:sugar ABC transporter substrate-binding protein n=1 Tax=Lysinibacillus sp. NPDC098008 TaxID=3364146 RepID=UPI00380CEFFB